MYIDRTVVHSPVYIGLCLDEECYVGEMKRLKVHIDETICWPKKGWAKTVTVERDDDKGVCCIVCMNLEGEHTEVEIYGLLVHETTHVWKQILDEMHERYPGNEIEAYAIQNIFQELAMAYQDLTKPTTTGKKGDDAD